MMNLIANRQGLNIAMAAVGATLLAWSSVKHDDRNRLDGARLGWSAERLDGNGGMSWRHALIGALILFPLIIPTA